MRRDISPADEARGWRGSRHGRLPGLQDPARDARRTQPRRGARTAKRSSRGARPSARHRAPCRRQQLLHARRRDRDGAPARGRPYAAFEEPCPYWELEWTQEVTRALSIDVQGGEQDNDMAQWRRMIAMRAVDIVQPDICYVGGLTRAWRVAKMAEAAGLVTKPHAANVSLVTVFTMHLSPRCQRPARSSSPSRTAAITRQAGDVRSGLEMKDGRAVMPDGPGGGRAHQSRLVSSRRAPAESGVEPIPSRQLLHPVPGTGNPPPSSFLCILQQPQKRREVRSIT